MPRLDPRLRTDEVCCIRWGTQDPFPPRLTAPSMLILLFKTSVVLATGTIVRAFYDRANFYSASVAIAQSNASLMVRLPSLVLPIPFKYYTHVSQILTNVALLGVSMSMLGLQRLFYGRLRPIEVEQLYEKAWFAITETCLAMTIFREEVGGWFLVMFVSLLIGKVWGWIGEGRVEILEQQPPANPRLFHAQLSISLLISSLFDFLMLQYAVNTVLRHARPNMMVMFAFEFAVLTVTSLSTAARYGISVFEANVIRKQVNERRAQIRRDRQQAQVEATRSQEPPGEAVHANTTTSEEDIDTMDIDPPGWEGKGRWIFYLDLTTGTLPTPHDQCKNSLTCRVDFLKLVLYLTFFCVLCMFYGMPIHIIRDVALTIRSFYKRITDFVRYRQATRDMNARYPDATPEEVAREDVCIICREDMRPWSQPAPPNDQPAGDQANNGAAASPVDERSRPKKLPCGHILHFACLRSWLERQQNCPTCRRPVLVPDTAIRTDAPNLTNQRARAQPQPQPQPHDIAAPAQLPGQVGQAGQNLVQAQNVYQFGPLRIAFGPRQGPQGPQQNNVAPALNQNAVIPVIGTLPRNGTPFARQGTQTRTVASFSPTTASSQLQQIEQQLMREINGLRLQHDQLYFVRALQGELVRLRLSQTSSGAVDAGPVPGSSSQNATPMPIIEPGTPVFTSNRELQSTYPNHQHLPTGMTIPEGWAVLPLRPLSGSPASNPEDAQPSSIGSMTRASHTSTTIPVDSRGTPETTAVDGGVPATEPLNVASPLSLHSDIGSAQLTTGGVNSDSSHAMTSRPSHVGVETPAADLSQSVPNLPNRDSDPAVSQDESTTKSSEVRAFDAGSDATGAANELFAESSAEGHRDKGKGKAATIEDIAEDVN